MEELEVGGGVVCACNELLGVGVFLTHLLQNSGKSRKLGCADSHGRMLQAPPHMQEQMERLYR